MRSISNRRYTKVHEQVLLSHAFSLLMGWLLTVALPSLAYWGLDDFATPDQGRFWGMVTSSVALALAHFTVHRLMSSYPGGRSIGMVIPNVVIIYLLSAIVPLSLHIGVSRYILVISGLAALLWFQLQYMVTERFRRPKLAIVPSGQALDLLGLPDIDGRELEAPDLKDKRYDGVVADFESLSQEWERFLARCALDSIPVYNARTVYESVTGRVRINRMSENDLGSLLPSPVYSRFKALLDSVLILLTAPISLPLVLFTALCIKLESPGPALYVQERMGLGNKPFKMYKLRSMRHEPGSCALFASEDDDRVTRVGRIIRKYRIDELPQFLNILKGEMSLIGPRPEQPDFVEDFDRSLPFYIYRHVVKPGITGWAQVRQGYAADVDSTREKIEHDFYYIKHCSLFLDGFIMLLTVKTMFTGFGAR